MNELFYFTNTFPLGLSPHWKKLEIDAISNSKKFYHIHVIPFIKEGNSIHEYAPTKDVTIHPPILKKWPKFTIKRTIECFLTKRFFTILKYLILEGAFSNKQRFIKFLSAINSSEALFNSSVFKEHLSTNNEQKTLYFFWGVNAAHAVPFLSKKFRKIIVRYHGYDLFEERNNGYIPLRKFQLKKVNLALYVSGQGLNYQESRYPTLKFDSDVCHLPVLTSETKSSYLKGTFNLLSCSHMVNIKRLDRLVDALSLIENCVINWTHIGDGELFKTIKEKATNLPSNIQYNFTGWLTPSEIDDFYINHPIDLFVNTSSTEGLPTSIVEAISHGVPILATNVGGTSEIVNEACGRLIPENFTSELLKTRIMFFIEQDSLSKEIFRTNAYLQFKKKFGIESVRNKLIECIS